VTRSRTPREVVGEIRALVAQGRVFFTYKALTELALLGLALDQEDAIAVLAALEPSELIETLRSRANGDWLHVFKPEVSAVVLYVKVIVRSDCVVVSFHEDEHAEEEDD
jgi:hypothetical protein